MRSSATTEDAEDASFAGLQDTFLWVLDAARRWCSVRECWGSLYSVEFMTYRRKQGLPEDGVAMAVVVQRWSMRALRGRDVHPQSPTTGDKSVITIEGAWGLGCAVVGGRGDAGPLGDRQDHRRDFGARHLRQACRQVPARRRRDRRGRATADERHAALPERRELQALRDVGRKVERHYGKPQDIEWAVDKAGELLLLQAAPRRCGRRRDALAAGQAAARTTRSST